MPLYNISLNFRADGDEQVLEVRAFMERMLCDFLQGRPASCVRVKVSEIDSDGHTVREMEDVQGDITLHPIPHA